MIIGYSIYKSPIGYVYIIGDKNGIKKITFELEEFEKLNQKYDLIKNYPQCEQAKVQMCEYFSGKRRKFNIKVNIEGTDFQKKVWNTVSSIPYGEVKSYKDIANMINNPFSVRAVGQANRRNPIPIIVPCHRVIGKSGKLTGYCGDKTYIKEFLIRLETKN